MEKDYSKREIDSKNEEMHKTLNAILVQTQKTNGRVSKLEDWQAYIRGALSILTIMVLPIFLFVVYSFISGKFK